MTGERVTPVEGIKRGLMGRCPACGEGRLFGRFLKVERECATCGQPFHHHRADDFPPYVVIFIVAHIVGYGIYLTESGYDLPLLFQGVVWPALAVVLSLALIQPVKGGVIGLQYALQMHGFGDRTMNRRGESTDDRGSRRTAEERVPER